ncbi:hypothetical protein Fmac_008595 [Flemingia macrophylla]|uniref:Uncharacterized protein n=1 Tax=Flemingia macrophylla TaxID=520843 RepID=A0ABD1N088_9FABA
MRWEKVKKLEGGPGQRWGHTCNAIKGGRLLYVFGGYCKHNRQANSVHIFDALNQTWKFPIIRGAPPTPRDSHSCTVVGDNLFVFGGTDGTTLLNDLCILDTSSHKWIFPIVRGEAPEAREGHAAAVVGKRLFVFGGCGRSSDNITEVYYNGLYILNTDTLIWKELSTSGQLLPPRAGHSTVTFGKNLFVFGGFTDAQSLYNDLYMLDIETGVWTKVTTIPNGPSARFSVAGDCLDPCMSGVLVFIGGCNKSLEGLDDMYYLYTGSLNSSPVSQSLPPGKKMFQANVTERNPAGYAIEAVIDGKPLRGVLFSNKPFTLNPVTNTSSRKRTSGDIVSFVSDGVHLSNPTTSKVLKQETMEDRQELQGDTSESRECHKEADTTVISSTPTTVAKSFKV